ncbi:Crp/Fnr family transcriptional regulator [Mucilaginibacter kameinonensis]|uniref:Crp/Fnr family transcriptional regulator n=1 Tax=Mucilaginibacter kameinonensis TaxID=452286 RepID=UPI000EF7787E|nr:Crp/Fnr family transcriptional regulator [Mucilaginibacter kameinonensis]
MNFREIVFTIKTIPEESFLKLEDIVKQVALPKGHLLFKANKINNRIYFIAKGISRAFIEGDQNEVTFAFFDEGKILLSIQSYVMDIAGYESIELLEDCELFQLHKNDLEALYSSDIHLANWGRKLADISFVETEKQTISRQFKSTLDRYEEFVKSYPDILQRVKLKHIASYLGMTQVSLSRIRAKDKRRLRQAQLKSTESGKSL